MGHSICRILVLLATVRVAYPLLVNHTIDDQGGDSVTGVKPVYYPPKAWQQGSTCKDCPPRGGSAMTLALNSTWHDATYIAGDGEPSSVSATFNGSAVYVYNIVVNNLTASTITVTDVLFFIDGDFVGRFSNVALPASAALVQYDVLVYKNESLEAKEHTVTMQANGQTDSVILFDYIVYTRDDGSDAFADDIASNNKQPSPHASSTPVQPSITAPPDSSSRLEGKTVSPSYKVWLIAVCAGLGCVIVAFGVVFGVIYGRERRRDTRPKHLSQHDGPDDFYDGNFDDPVKIWSSKDPALHLEDAEPAFPVHPPPVPRKRPVLETPPKSRPTSMSTPTLELETDPVVESSPNRCENYIPLRLGLSPDIKSDGTWASASEFQDATRTVDGGFAGDADEVRTRLQTLEEAMVAVQEQQRQDYSPPSYSDVGEPQLGGA